MKVDMSPQAVGQRLRTMDDLWLLSMKLMQAKRVARHAPLSKNERAIKIQESIRHILFYDWDPIGISDQSNVDDEYDSYVGPVYRMLAGDCSEDELIKLLLGLERDSMGMCSKSPELLRPTAQKLIGLNVHLNRKTDR